MKKATCTTFVNILNTIHEVGITTKAALMTDQLLYTEFWFALTEFCHFQDIPVKVTINEYIELSKFYSTPDSRRFVNGILDKLAEELTVEGKLVKVGRGKL